MGQNIIEFFIRQRAYGFYMISEQMGQNIYRLNVMQIQSQYRKYARLDEQLSVNTLFYPDISLKQATVNPINDETFPGSRIPMAYPPGRMLKEIRIGNRGDNDGR